MRRETVSGVALPFTLVENAESSMRPGKRWASVRPHPLLRAARREALRGTHALRLHPVRQRAHVGSA